MNLHNDEPSSVDMLNREKVADALADAILVANTPLVVGIYGSWGVGKTSLMRLMEDSLVDKENVESIWFDPWFHQFDDNPEIALLHAMVKNIKGEEKQEVRKLLGVIGVSIGASVLKTFTGISAKEIREYGTQYEEEMFEVREKRARLQDKFGELIDLITNKGTKRLVVFIDDLDRCSPSTILKILDSLKLYLSHEGCVYVVGIDRAIVEKSIQSSFKGIDGYEGEYLDKLIQLPFNVPAIGKADLEKYIKSHLPSELSSVAELFVGGLDGNPRKIKRVINAYILSYSLAKSLGDVYIDKEILGLLLLIQHRAPDVYISLIKGDNRLKTLLAKNHRERDDITSVIGGDESLVNVLLHFKEVKDINWSPYIFLYEASSVEDNLVEVWMTGGGARETEIIRTLRRLTGMSQSDARTKLNNVPIAIATSVTKEDAERLCAAIRAVGAEAEIRG